MKYYDRKSIKSYSNNIIKINLQAEIYLCK